MSNPNCPNLKKIDTLSRALAAFLLPSETRRILDRRDPEAVEAALGAMEEVNGKDWREKMLAEDDVKLFEKLDTSRCQEHFTEVVAFAKANGKWGTDDNGDFRACLERLAVIGRTTKPVLFKDFAPNSFTWDAGGLYGGCIWHESDRTFGLHT